LYRDDGCAEPIDSADVESLVEAGLLDSAVWGGFRQQICLTQSRKEREGKSL
jgi:hypothetical protein